MKNLKNLKNLNWLKSLRMSQKPLRNLKNLKNLKNLRISWKNLKNWKQLKSWNLLMMNWKQLKSWNLLMMNWKQLKSWSLMLNSNQLMMNQLRMQYRTDRILLQLLQKNLQYLLQIRHQLECQILLNFYVLDLNYLFVSNMFHHTHQIVLSQLHRLMFLQNTILLFVYRSLLKAF